MLTGKNGIELIKSFEGFRSYPYLCPSNVWTIGYGHTKGIHKNSPSITKEQGESLLKEDLQDSEQAIKRLIYAEITQNMFDALVSFVFNLGSGALQRSTLRQKLNRLDYNGAANEFPKWCFAAGRKSKGILRRRLAEKELFLS